MPAISQTPGGCATPCTCGGAPTCVQCTPCALPTTGLNVSWSLSGTVPAGNANLVWNSTAWVSACTPYSTSGTLSWIVITLNCVSDVLVFSVSLYTGSSCGAGILLGTCSTPVASGFTAGAPTSCFDGTILYTRSTTNCALLSTNFTLNIPSNTCPRLTTCIGCNGLPMAGESINVYNHSGGTLLETDTCDIFGVFSSSLAAGDYYAVPTNGRFAGSPFAIGSNINFLPTTPNYYCIRGCVDPLAAVLHFTDSVYGSWTITYSTVTSTWVGSPATQPAYPGCCNPSCSIASPMSLTARLLSIGDFSYCNGTVCLSQEPVTGYLTCAVPGPFQYQQTFSSSAGCTGCGFDPTWTSWLCAASTTITITE